MNKQVVRTLLRTGSTANMVKACEMLQEGDDLEFLNDLLAMLKHRDGPVRIAAVTATSILLKRNLTQNFSQLTPTIREGIAKILGSLDPNVVDHIAIDLESENGAVRLRAVQVLGCMGDNPRIREILQKLLTDKSERVRATSVSLLGQMIHGVDLSAIGKLLKDPDTRVVANCVETLESVGNPKMVELLSRLKSHPSNRVRGNVLKALWNLGDTNIYPDLESMLGNADHLFRATACWVIGQVGKHNLDPFPKWLCEKLQDKHLLVRQNAIKALLNFGGKAAELCKAQADPHELREILAILAKRLAPSS